MNQRKFDKLFQHYEKYFGGSYPAQIHRFKHVKGLPDIAVIRFTATEKFPYQVLATIGASTHLMRRKGMKPHRCEFVAFVPADWAMTDVRHAWVLEMLHLVSIYSAMTGNVLTYGSTLDMEQQLAHLQSDRFNMIGAALLLPEAAPDPSILHCRTGLFSSAMILQMMPITREELLWYAKNQNLTRFMRYFYPENASKTRFLCARRR